jgi:NAD(P)-dependent dehydrogenase (short-subunit alcohol dehydrogenase family)
MLTDKVALITGASRGIGQATAIEMAAQGAAVVLAARSKNILDKTVQQIVESGGQAIAVECDVGEYDEVARAATECVAQFGRLDILVNNAGLIDPIARLEDSDPLQWSEVVDVNLKGVYFGIRAVLPLMKQQGGGVIVNVSSGAATGALEGWSHYCATKAGVLSLTKCTHKEEAENGIRVVGMSPGTVATDMQVSIKKSGINPVSELDPSVHIPVEWPAKAIAWLCTDAASEFDGGDFSLKTDEGRRLVGLI